MTTEINKSLASLLERKDIISALDDVNGWYNSINDEFIAISENAKFHKSLKEKYYKIALDKLSEKENKDLNSKFCHKTHFLNGVTKKYALEYYFDSLDFHLNAEKRTISGGVGKITVAMMKYYVALVDTAKDILNGVINVDILLDNKYKAA